MAFMSYNPSIGRVLEPGGVGKFRGIATKLVEELHNVKAIIDFDHLHDIYVKKLICGLRTSRKSRLSYGQAQKPINVFLKVYVDWAHKPNSSVRQKIIPYLHVPLDSILMKSVRGAYPEWYDDEIAPYVRNKTQLFSLSKIDKRMYYRWQHFFRTKSPKKPLIFDIAWAVNR
jgi:hypothetical protein